MEKEMATHSSTLAWRIPWMEEPGGLQSMESQSRTQLSDFTSLYGSRVVDRDLLPLVVVVQSLSLVQLFATPWTAAPVHHQLPELGQTRVH